MPWDGAGVRPACSRILASFSRYCRKTASLPRSVGRALQSGIELEDGPAKVDSFRLVDTLGKIAQIEIVLHEGRKHIVRRMMEAVGHPVSRLIRTAVGPIRLGDMRPGGFRHLSNAEIAALFKAVSRDGEE